MKTVEFKIESEKRNYLIGLFLFCHILLRNLEVFVGFFT